MNRTYLSLPLSLGLVLMAPALASAQAKTFMIRDDGGSRASFVSDATLETITGVTAHLKGELQIDPKNVAASKGTIRVSVATLRTGNDLRDEHLRNDKWLDAKRFPEAIFEITSVSGATSLTPNQETKLQLKGKFTIHGVTKPITVQAKVKWVPITPEMRNTPGITGDVIRGTASFSIKLTDFGVTVPSIVQLKVSNEISVSVALRAVAS